jgi:hypothetical protein
MQICEESFVIMYKLVKMSVDFLYPLRKPILISAFIALYLFSSATITLGEEPTQLVIGVAEWRHASGPEIAVQQNIYHRITDKLIALDLDDFEVVQLQSWLNNADDVDLITERYGIDILVWGWYDEVAVRGYVDLANATEENGMNNSLAAYLENDGNPLAIRVLKLLNEFDYYEDGVSFCVPRWTP